MSCTLASTPAAAATLLVSATGVLTGATGVKVNDTLYDVEFVDGTCAAVFTGCDSVSDFTFTTASDAETASEALLLIVFRDVDQGTFDSTPNLTLGCTRLEVCIAETPFGFNSVIGATSFFVSQNGGAVGGFEDRAVLVEYFQPLDSAAFDEFVYARWTEIGPAAVPQPATLTLLGLGLAGMGARRWRRKAA